MSQSIVFETSVGSFTVELYNQHAPKTCHNFEGWNLGKSKKFMTRWMVWLFMLTLPLV